MNREELAWVGGFFSGEGCFTLNRRWVHADIRQANDREPLDRVVAATGLGKVTGPYRYSNGNMRQGQYVYGLYSFEKVQALAAMLWPWLSTAKRDAYRRMVSVVLRQEK